MEQNRFFRFVWRFNGIAIMLLALGLLVLAIVIGGFALFDWVFSPSCHVPVITSVAEDPEGKEQWQLGRPRYLGGTEFVYLPLESKSKGVSLSESFVSYSRISDYNTRSRNLLFVNKQTREMKWLFPSNRQIITWVRPLADPSQDSSGFSLDWFAQVGREDSRQVKAILYTIVRQDTDNDGKLTADDLENVAISNPDGTRFTELLQAVDYVFESIPLEDGQVLIIYQSQGIGYAATIRLEDMSIQETQEIPKVEEAS